MSRSSELISPKEKQEWPTTHEKTLQRVWPYLTRRSPALQVQHETNHDNNGWYKNVWQYSSRDNRKRPGISTAIMDTNNYSRCGKQRGCSQHSSMNIKKHSSSTPKQPRSNRNRLVDCPHGHISTNIHRRRKQKQSRLLFVNQCFVGDLYCLIYEI